MCDNKVIVEAKALCETVEGTLEVRMEKLIKDGFVPQGSISTCVDESNIFFSILMVKYEWTVA